MLKIKTYQKYGIKTDELVDEFEFCCWDDLKNWLDSFTGLNRCPECNAKAQTRMKARLECKKFRSVKKLERRER